MALPAGTRLGGYTITSALGAGGMGEVYRARDARLNRDVAIKILPAAFAADVDRVARFTREAQTLAALNHPHIAQIYGIEDLPTSAATGVTNRALVMELVEGETLAECIARGRASSGPAGEGGRLPIDDVLRIARQLADALDAAHERGIVHRDLKPANIKVRTDGTVKVLDFGLAKARDDEERGSSPAALTSPAVTMHGVILGTAAYMSPEQARGGPVDKRTDVWAFGCVLYEMLTGRLAFAADDVQDTLALVLRGEPDWSALPPSLPQRLDALLRGCLEKDRLERISDIAVARFELRQMRRVSESAGSLSAVTSLPARRNRLMPATPWVVALAALIAAAVVSTRRDAATPVAPRIRFEVDFAGVQVELAANTVGAALSPDGSTIVFAGSRADGPRQLFVRRLDDSVVTELRGTDHAMLPFFSPAGDWIAFFAAGQLKKVPLSGGAATIVADDVVRPFGGHWGTEGSIVFATDDSGLTQVSADGGEVRALTALTEGDHGHRWPQWIDDGRAVLFTALRAAPTGTQSQPSVMVQRLADGVRRELAAGATLGRLLPNGPLVYVIGSQAYAVAFDLPRLSTTGRSAQVLDNLFTSMTGNAQVHVAPTGAALAGLGSLGTRRLAWITRGMSVAPLAVDAGEFWDPRLAPNGRLLAVTIGADIWIYDLERDTRTRLTTDGQNNWDPLWSPDSRGLLFVKGGPAGGGGVFWQPADGSSDAMRLIADPALTPISWHPDGRLVAANRSRVGQNDIVLLAVDGDSRGGWRVGSETVLVSSRASESEPAFSPDGRWIAYQSNESGRFEVYVRPYPGPGTRAQISTGGGMLPTWSADGRELLYRTPDHTLISAALNASADGMRASPPAPWSTATLGATGVGQRTFDVHPDGRRVLALIDAQASKAPLFRLLFISHFADDVNRALSTQR